MLGGDDGASDAIDVSGRERSRSGSEFLAAGAALVAVGTEIFRDPRAGKRVAGENAGVLETIEAPLSRHHCLNLDSRLR